MGHIHPECMDFIFNQCSSVFVHIKSLHPVTGYNALVLCNAKYCGQIWTLNIPRRRSNAGALEQALGNMSLAITHL